MEGVREHFPEKLTSGLGLKELKILLREGRSFQAKVMEQSSDWLCAAWAG